MNTINFHKSTAAELNAVKSRVRNLINHWGEDGRYQEAVIRTMIQRFLPERYRVGTGFVVRQTDERGVHQPSKQIDILIYDTSYPILFKETDFVILTADAVAAIIEVKANLINQGLRDVVRKANENGKFIYEARKDKTKPLFNGIFSYDSTMPVQIKTTSQGIFTPWQELDGIANREDFVVNHISFNEHWFYKFWKQEIADRNRPHFLYTIPDLSFSFFISNLMDWLGEKSVVDNHKLWFPVDKSFNVEKTF